MQLDRGRATESRPIELAPLMSAFFDGVEPLLERESLQTLHALPEQRYWLLQDIQALLEAVRDFERRRAGVAGLSSRAPP